MDTMYLAVTSVNFREYIIFGIIGNEKKSCQKE